MIELTPWLLLLLVPAPALGVFLILGLDPYRLRRDAVNALALLGGVAPMLVMVPLSVACGMGECHVVVPVFTLVVGQAEVALALLLDPLSALVGSTVTVVGAAVMVYAVQYMDQSGMADLRRFFALMNLFLASMLTMVLAGDTITFFFGWELMGLCSFFLIAFHTDSAQAVAAGRKAFIITRFADVFLLAALLLLFLEAASVRMDTLIPAGEVMEPYRLTIVALLLLGGALGKSAQLPFHTWLPSAMAGPTPVSALLHSATMVAAGAYLMVRFSPIVAAAPNVLTAAAVLGTATAAFGALSAIFQQDVKRMLAYSSISQIGYMMLAIGVGAPEVAIAHFVIHALFKSLLFLAAGDITHGCPAETGMESMRGAWRRKPLSYLAFVAGAVSLAGLPVITAGWWSKEAILASALGSGPLGVVLWSVALGSAVLTGAYIFRPVFLGLVPERRSVQARHSRHAAAEAATAAHHASRFSSPLAAVPMVLLALGALFGGAAVGPMIRFQGAEMPHIEGLTMWLAAAAPLLGAVLALALTFVPVLVAAVAGRSRTRRGVKVDGIYRYALILPFVKLILWLSRGAEFDGIYRQVFVRPFVRGVSWLNGYRGGIADPVGTLPVLAVLRAHRFVVERVAIDRLDGGWMRLAAGLVGLWGVARRVQTGRTREYALALAIGTAILLMLAWDTTWN
ncbi:NADH-quinone oxidoreductase subunit L [Paracoccaceae bacterium Fryx2]|nr:NADH-quinone oxidoreductase subunit L [Paracoccaceae bacterium Fryx2]